MNPLSRRAPTRFAQFIGTAAWLAAALPLVVPALAQSPSPPRQIRHLDFLVRNPAAARFAGIVCLDAADVVAALPEFDGLSFLVTTTGAPDPAIDRTHRRAQELPSQCLDEDLDGRPDRIAVALELNAGETKVIAIHEGPSETILRLKGSYRPAAGATRLARGASGVCESSLVAYRFTPAAGIAVLPKVSARPIAEQMTMMALHAGQPPFLALPIAPDSAATVEICADGPLVGGLAADVAGNRVTLLTAETDRWAEVQINLGRTAAGRIVTAGLGRRTDEVVFSGERWVATHAGGLGLALHAAAPYFAGLRNSGGEQQIALRADEAGHIRYAVAGFSAHELQGNVVLPGETDTTLPRMPGVQKYGPATGRILLRPARPDSSADFRLQLSTDLAKLENPPVVTRLSARAEFPPALASQGGGTPRYREALESMFRLLRTRQEKAAGQFWFSAAPDGTPTFKAPRRTWGDGYLVSMLWDGFRVTGDDWFRAAALDANQRMLGGEQAEMHATGLNFWNGSARTFRETGDSRWRGSALDCADMLLRIADPVTGLIPEYGRALRQQPDDPYHEQNYVKIDALVGLPILWWAARETGDARYREAAQRHLDRTLEWLVEPDGSALQMLWQRPGTSEILGIGTSQGYGGNTRWARGIAWVLDSLPDAYGATPEPRYRDAFARSARWLEANLPPDLIAWYDFDDQGVFWRFRDSSTSAICASGLLRMSALEPDPARARHYREFGTRIVDQLLNTCLVPAADPADRPAGMLAHACYTKPQEGEFIWGSHALITALRWLTEHPLPAQF